MSEPDTTIGTDQGPPPVPFTIERGSLAPEHEAAALEGAAVADRPHGVIDVTGPGAVACVQGVLTNDVEAHGEHGFVYGALLTPKGMIQTDLWVGRTADRLMVITPPHGRDTALQVFRRYFPPRLARTTDRTDSIHVIEVLGPTGTDAVSRAGAPLPSRAGTTAATIAGAECLLCRPGAAPFQLLVICERDRGERVRAELEEAGASVVPPETADLVRVLAGWPLLGAEIGTKTLPQEVRFDELDAVSYTKGCYTGQETVARVHFRGQANRWLAGMVWRNAPAVEDATITRDSKAVGRVTSAVWSDAWQLWLGLGLIRREVSAGTVVTACGETAQVVRVPIPTP
jgi:folate-binding protein YgfZ